MTLDVRVQLLEKVCGVLGAETSKMLVFQKEVHTQVRFGDDNRVLDGKVANARQDKVLKRFGTNDSGPVIDK